MQHYKAPDNSVHCIEPEFSHLLPSGCVPITEKTAEKLRLANIPEPDKKIAAISYLAETDWYVTRFAETGKEIPKDILEKRAKARIDISD
jgi:hypothetical protein